MIPDMIIIIICFSIVIIGLVWYAWYDIWSKRKLLELEMIIRQMYNERQTKELRRILSKKNKEDA